MDKFKYEFNSGDKADKFRTHVLKLDVKSNFFSLSLVIHTIDFQYGLSVLSLINHEGMIDKNGFTTPG